MAEAGLSRSYNAFFAGPVCAKGHAHIEGFVGALLLLRLPLSHDGFLTDAAE